MGRYRLSLGLVILLQLFINIASAQVNTNSVWPMFRHDVRHTGASPYTGPGQPSLKWTYQTGDGVASSPAIGADGTIYVGSGWFWQSQHDTTLYAINPNGTLKWQFPADGGIFSSPAIDQNGTIYFGSLDKYFYAIEDSITYPKLKWRVFAGHWIMGSPLISGDGTVYFGSLNFKFFAVDPSGNIKWQDQVGWCIFSSPALDYAGNIIVGSKDHNLYSYKDLGYGFLRNWNYSIGSFYDGHLIDASPAIGTDGTIYFGADQYGAAGHPPVPIDTAFYAVKSNGTLKWLYRIGDGVESSPALGKNGMIYFGSYDSSVYALKDNITRPQQIWKYKTGGVVDASPTIGGDGTIYIGSRDSTLYAFNPDGSIQWTYKAGGGIESSVTIVGDGVIYFGGMDGKIYALGTASQDVGPVSINIPSFINPQENFNPSITARNYRVTPADFALAFTIDTAGTVIYADTGNILNLAGGDSAAVNLNPWTVGSGTNIVYNLNITSILPGDGNRHNDSLFLTASTGLPYACGDANNNGSINILDITFLMNYLYKGGPAPNPFPAGDPTDNGAVNILDITFLVAYLYKNGPEPNCL